MEVTISELEATSQNPKEPFIDFIARWRTKAAWMTNMPLEREQVWLVVQNLEPDMLQRMIVASLSTFAALHKLGVQIESVFKKGIISRTSELIKRPFTRGTNASNNTIPRPVEISTVTTTTKIADPFAGAASQPTGPTRNQYRTFTPLHMSLTHALKPLTEKGHLKPLDHRPLPDLFPAKHDPAQYCVFYKQHGHPMTVTSAFVMRSKISSTIRS